MAACVRALSAEGRPERADLGQYEAVGFDMGWVALEMLGKGLRLASAAAIVIYFLAMTQPAMGQSTDGSRPGDLFFVEQVGQAAGQVLKNNGIYLDSGYLNDILADVKGGNETGVTSTGDAFVAAHFDMNTIAGIPNASMHIIFDDRTGKNTSTLALSLVCPA